MFHFFKDNKEITAIVSGTIIPLEKVNDPVFSNKMMGEGIAFVHEDDEIASPISGKIVFIFETGHCFGVKRKDGLELLVHIGIDTVNQNGDGFKALVKQNQYVKQGQPIIKLNRDKLLSNGCDLTTMLIVTSFDSNMLFKTNYYVNKGDKLYREEFSYEQSLCR